MKKVKAPKVIDTCGKFTALVRKAGGKAEAPSAGQNKYLDYAEYRIDFDRSAPILKALVDAGFTVTRTGEAVKAVNGHCKVSLWLEGHGASGWATAPKKASDCPLSRWN